MMAKMIIQSFFSDNDFEYIPPEIKNMVNLRILALRDNELVEIPQVFSNDNFVSKY